MKFLSALVSDARGKLGGMVAARNRAGNYLRRWVSPTNPQSAAQTLVRNLFSYLSWAWTYDTEQSQQTAWDDYAAVTPLTDSLGQTYYTTGQNWFVGNNVVRQQCGLLAWPDGPVTPGLPELTPPTLSATTTTSSLTLHVEPTDDWASDPNGGLAVSIATERSPGVNFCKGPYKFATFIPGSASGITSAQTFSIGRTNGDVGNKLFVSVRALDAGGRVSRPFPINGSIE